MSPTNTQPAPKRSEKKPEKEFATRGLKVAVWLNSTETDEGVRHFRAFSISPRRYRDEKSGEWKDAAGYRPVDVATLQFLLRQVEGFLLTTPLPGVADHHDAAEIDEADIPF